MMIFVNSSFNVLKLFSNLFKEGSSITTPSLTLFPYLCEKFTICAIRSFEQYWMMTLFSKALLNFALSVHFSGMISRVFYQFHTTIVSKVCCDQLISSIDTLFSIPPFSSLSCVSSFFNHIHFFQIFFASESEFSVIIFLESVQIFSSFVVSIINDPNHGWHV